MQLIKSQYDESSIYFGKGVINSIDDDLIFEVNGKPSARISLHGSFTGVLEITGFDDMNDVIRGGRVMFKSAIGSTAKTKIVGNGELKMEEIGINGGSRYVSIRPVSFSSGSIEIGLFATTSPYMVFVNGSVHTAEDDAVRDERSFTVSTGEQTLSITDNLYCILKNPAGSGKNILLTERIFGTNNKTDDTPVFYKTYLNPTAVLTGTLPPINRWIGGSASIAAFSFQKATDITMGGTQGTGEPIPVGGIVRERKFLAVIPPSYSLGFSVQGTNNLNHAITAFINFQWFEETVV